MFSANVLKVILQLRLLLSGDVELNPGPRPVRLGEQYTRQLAYRGRGEAGLHAGTPAHI